MNARESESRRMIYGCPSESNMTQRLSKIEQSAGASKKITNPEGHR
jgi:hypothetical protein